MNTKKLQMEFLNEAGNKYTITIDSPKEDLTNADVKNAMEEIISQNIFLSSTLDLVGISGAKIVETSIQPFEV